MTKEDLDNDLTAQTNPFNVSLLRGKVEGQDIQNQFGRLGVSARSRLLSRPTLLDDPNLSLPEDTGIPYDGAAGSDYSLSSSISAPPLNLGTGTDSLHKLNSDLQSFTGRSLNEFESTGPEDMRPEPGGVAFYMGGGDGGDKQRVFLPQGVYNAYQQRCNAISAGTPASQSPADTATAPQQTTARHRNQRQQPRRVRPPKPPRGLPRIPTIRAPPKSGKSTACNNPFDL